MGLSRVYLGHHWLTDVVAGWLIGLAWALAVITAHRLWLTLRDSGESAESGDAGEGDERGGSSTSSDSATVTP